MTLREPQETALLLAVIFKRSGEKRARISERTLKLLGYRFRLRCAFTASVTAYLSELGLALIELEKGAFGLIPSKSLEAAKAITAKRWLTDDELYQVKHGQQIDINALWEELDEQEDADHDDEDA